MYLKLVLQYPLAYEQVSLRANEVTHDQVVAQQRQVAQHGPKARRLRPSLKLGETNFLKIYKLSIGMS